MDVQRLTRTAARLFGDLGPAGALTVRELPDGLGICVWQTGVRGGGTIFVGCDETVLFVGSATGFDAGLAAFRQGRRTPAERFRSEP
ncbi:hypothetical protein C8D88_10580 [Lentzea atacamensis]|uniref:Uncharacterized protein n=1 Tax=Lentzea atacamensis TaxID=531938 RepID=A0A316I161_9PSEU|nr:hypothetical protein [Lentzea atacamensis]PWK86040.1 hypothetical protein C8D88_10580 [Lentzea atacamensis]RAS65529.1 hypothetical protein C8D87_10476 [Lentzea atacamensis]